jgi:hypothetical protein
MEPNILCTCGKAANCFLTDAGWVCKACFDHVLQHQKLRH